jgi:hypothetical protein
MTATAVRAALDDQANSKFVGRTPKDPDSGRLCRLKYHITCKCPKCEKLHDAAVPWTGRGTPRLFCPNCRNKGASHNAGPPTLRVGGIMDRNIRRGAYRGHE